MSLFSSLRSRVWLLVAMVALPLLAYALLVYLDHRNHAMAKVEQDLQQLIHSALVQEERLVSHTRAMLRIMASSEEIKQLDPAECSRLAQRLLETQSDFLTLGALLADGTPLCGELPGASRVKYGHSPWFHEVMTRKGVSRGYYLADETGLQQPGILFAYPVMDKTGQVKAVTYAVVGISRLASITFADKLPQEWEGALAMADGTILFQLPMGKGKEPGGLSQDGALAELLGSRPVAGMRELTGPDNLPHLYGMTSLSSTCDGLYIVIRALKSEVLAPAEWDFRNHLILLLLLGIASILIGQQTIYHFLVRWTESLHGNIRRIADGEQNVKFEENSSIRELREIDAALNAMIDGINANSAALRISQERLDQVLEGGNLGTWDWFASSSRVSCSARFVQMLGYAPDEFSVDTNIWEQRICPEDRPAIQAVIERHFKEDSSACEFEFRMRHRDGYWVWLLVHGWVVERTQAGKPVRMAGTALDISSRRQTEQQLRQRTEELVALVEAMPAMVWIARDSDCREIVGNRAACELLTGGSPVNGEGSIRPELFSQVPCYDQEGRQYAQRDLPIFQAVFECQPVRGKEFLACFPDGRKIWLYGSAVPLFDDAGSVRGAVAAFMDISRFKEAEEALRRSESELAQAEQIAHLGSWAIELQNSAEPAANRIRCSDEMFRLFGYQPGEVTPTADLFFERAASGCRQQLVDEFKRAIAQKRSFSQEYRIVLADGSERILMDYGDFRYDAQGNPTHCFGAVQDITARKQIEIELQRHRTELENLVAERTYELAVAKEAAERANRTKSQFLANVTHELKTPLSSLMLLAQTLAENDPGNLLPQQVEYAQMIELSGNDLMQLIDELLDLAKLETGRLDVRVQSVAFPDVMQNVHRTHRHVAKKKELDFKMEIDADVPASIVTDSMRLQQLLRNLLSNAIKFTVQGSVTLRIRRAVSGWRFSNPTLANADTVIAFDVIDTGIGIDAGQQQGGFEQINKGMPQESGGTGLGLAISREMAGLLGGELGLTSVPGQGSTFTLYLPLVYAGPISPVMVEPKSMATHVV